MIEWKGLHANTPYSSANNKTQDDAVVGMQDTIYVTGPGYGGYEANVRVHNASGAVVALIPVCGRGGALSAPAPVRILDDSTTYSYSLEVVRGAVPADDPDKIAIRIIGGASKRYPGQSSTLPDGSTSFAGHLRVAGGVVAENVTPLGALLPKTRAALARASVGGGALRAVLLGDSTVVAFGAVGGAQDIAGNAQRSIGKHMLTWVPKAFRVGARRDSFFGSGSILYSDATKAQYDSRITQSGSGISYDSLRSIGDGAIKFSAINDTITFTPENPFTSVSIRSLGGVGGWGSVEVKINNVSVGTISAAAGSGYNLTTYTGSWVARTPITITNLDVGNRLFDLFSVECKDSAFRGISILEMGWSGCTIADLTSDDYAWQHLPALVEQAPDLVILKCTTNDSGSPMQSSIATPAAAYAASLKKLRDALPNADIVFADCFPSAYADLNPGALDGFKRAAIDLGMPVIDLREIFGDTSTTALATGLAIGPVHPGEVTYSLYARTVSERIASGLGNPLIGTLGGKIYERYEDLPMYGNAVGDEARVKRILGDGFFFADWDGVRWGARPGSPVVGINSETTYTSVGTAFVSLLDATIPAGLIGDGELWETTAQVTQISGTNDIASSVKLRLGASDIWNNPGAITATPYSFDIWPRRIRRSGSTYKRYTSSISDQMASDEVSNAVNLGSAQTLSIGVTPAAIGNVYKVRRLHLARVS